MMQENNNLAPRPDRPFDIPPPPAGGVGHGSPDILQVLLRWKWLPIMGSIIGICVGYLICVQTPKTYTSMARIQVYSPKPTTLPIAMVESSGLMGSVNSQDQVLVIKGSVVVNDAIRLGSLSGKIKDLTGITDDEILEWVRRENRLIVEPGNKDNNTEVIDIKFTCEDADLSRDVVESIVEAYQRHLGSSYQTAGEDVVAKIRAVIDSQNSVSKKLEADQAALVAAASQSGGLVFEGKEARSIDSDAYLTKEKEIQQKQSQLIKISSVLEQIKKAVDEGRPIAGVLEMVSNFDQDLSARIQRDAFVEERVQKSTTRSDQIQSEIRGLDVRMNALMLRWGPNHPEVEKTRTMIDALKETLKQTQQEEQLAYDEILEKRKMVGSEAISVEDRLKRTVAALEEYHGTTKREIEYLQSIANEYRERSRRTLEAITRFNYLNHEIGDTKAFLEELNRAVMKFTYDDENARIMKRIEIPRTGALAGPRPLLYILIGAMIGGVTFAGLAYLLELADRSFRSPDEISHELGIPILGHIPMTEVKTTDRKDDKVDLSLVTVHRSKSSQSEAFRGIRTGLYFSNRAGNMKVIQVTSPVPGDGKSTTAGNLAVSIAQSGRSVLLIDADFRRPRVAKLFGMREDIGIASVVAGNAELLDAIQETSVNNLSVLACGRRPSNPAELLSSERFAELLSVIRDKFDYIILDTPPLLAVSDPGNIAPQVDGVILTLRLRRNLKPLAVRAAQMLHSLNANMIGIVVNGVGGKGGYGYGGYRYGSSYGYGYRGAYGKGGYGQAGYGYGGYGYGGYGGKGYGYGGYGYGGTYGYGDDYGVKEYFDDETGTRRARRVNGAAPAQRNIANDA